NTMVLLLAFIAMTIALGFGTIGVVRNIFAGLVIGLQRPFRTGDRIRVGDLEGEVIHIGVRATVLRSADGARVEIPNQQFVENVVTNSALQDIGAPVEVEIPLPEGVDIAAIKTLARRAALVSKY